MIMENHELDLLSLSCLLVHTYTQFSLSPHPVQPTSTLKSSFPHLNKKECNNDEHKWYAVILSLNSFFLSLIQIKIPQYFLKA